MWEGATASDFFRRLTCPSGFTAELFMEQQHLKEADFCIQEMPLLLRAGGTPWRGLGHGFCGGRLT